jgi:hypothetical protein
MASNAHNRIFATAALALTVLLCLLVGSAGAQSQTKCQKAHKAACKRDYRAHGKEKAKAKRQHKRRLASDQHRVSQSGGAVAVSSGSKSSSSGSGGTSSGKGKEKSPPTAPVEEATKPVEEAVSDTCVSIAAIAQSTWAPSCWRPYSNTSPWNQPVSVSAPSTANSSAVVQRLASWGPVQNLIAGNSESGSDYYHPIYFATTGDPIYKLEPTRHWGTSQIAGESIPIPAAARPADGSDHHMAVVTPDGWEYDFWDVESKPESGGTLRFGWGGKTRIDGDGLGSNATAAHFGLAAGVIRAPELEAGHVDHALFMAVKCTDSGAATVYPAAPGTNDACTEQAGISNTNAPAMGSRFVLQMSDAEIGALQVPSWKKTILTAMAHYGMFVGDAFGGASWGLQFESGATYTSFGAEDKLSAIARREGVPTWNGQYVFDLNSGINWQSKLRVVAPCYTERSC